jgi:ABC-type amino acid transport substrate-binding protein
MKLDTVLVACLGLVLTPVLLADEPLRLATSAQHPPFNMLADDGRVIGFDADLVRALCDQIGRKCTLTAVAEAQLVEDLKAGQHDAVIATALPALQGQQGVVYGKPYHSAHVRFIAAAGKEFDATTKGLKLGALAQSASLAYLNETHAGSAEIRVFDDRETLYTELSEGKLDAILDDALVGFNWLVKPDHMGHDFAGEVIDVNLKSAILFRADDTSLREAFDKGLDGLLEKGIYERINRNYFPFKTY